MMVTTAVVVVMVTMVLMGHVRDREEEWWLGPEDKLWHTTRNQSMHRTGRKLGQPVTTRMRPRTAVCIPDLDRSMSVTLRLKYWNKKLLTVKRMPLKAAKRRPMAPP